MLIKKYPIQTEQLPFPKENFPEGSLFFDIETTGLSRRNSHLYMIGAIYKEADQLQFIQWFLQRPTEEATVLQEFSALLQHVHTVIHYNGQTFDVPYIREKCSHWGLKDPFSEDRQIQSLDLYRKVFPLKKVLQLSSLKQKDVEILLRYPRTDQMDGKELIQVYHDYLNTADEKALHLLLLHNRDDLFGMLTIYGFHAALLQLTGQSSGVRTGVLPSETAAQAAQDKEADSSSPERVAEKMNLQLSLDEDILKICIELPASFPVGLTITNDYGSLCTDQNTLILSLSGYRGSFRHYFSNYKDYFYLPLEDTAIHKSVGIYVDPSCREKAKADTCYTKKEGLFFFQPSAIFQPDFHADNRKGPSFFLFEQIEKEPEKVEYYVHQLITSFLKF